MYGQEPQHSDGYAAIGTTEIFKATSDLRNATGMNLLLNYLDLSKPRPWLFLVFLCSLSFYDGARAHTCSLKTRNLDLDVVETRITAFGDGTAHAKYLATTVARSPDGYLTTDGISVWAFEDLRLDLVPVEP